MNSFGGYTEMVVKNNMKPILYLIIGFAVGLCLALAFIWMSSGLPSEFWEATSATGTMLAVGVALWLAGASARQAKAEAHDRAYVAAALAIGVISDMHTRISPVYGIVHGDKVDEGANELLRSQKLFSTPDFEIASEILINLIALDRYTSVRIAHGISLANSIRKDMERTIWGGNWQQYSVEVKKNCIARWHTDLTTSKYSLEAALRKCEKVAKEAAPKLTGADVFLR